jgi:hypothetical protein
MAFEPFIGNHHGYEFSRNLFWFPFEQADACVSYKSVDLTGGFK